MYIENTDNVISVITTGPTGNRTGVFLFNHVSFSKPRKIREWYTVLSPIKAPLLIEAPPNFESWFLRYIMFVTVAPGSLNLI